MPLSQAQIKGRIKNLTKKNKADTRPVDVRLGLTEAEWRPNVQWTFDQFKSCRIDFLMP